MNNNTSKATIWFLSGTHGNYLEHVLNSAILNDFTTTPFNDLGASHKFKFDYRPVRCKHPFPIDFRFKTEKNILITTEPDDHVQLLPLIFRRVADTGIDINNLTDLNVFDNTHYEYFKDTFVNYINGFDTVIQAYQAIKDPSWPELSNKNDFWTLPLEIQDECINQHNLIYVDLEHGIIPKIILQKYFKEHFFGNQTEKSVWAQGMLTSPNEEMIKNNIPEENWFLFPYRSFYHWETFIDNILNVLLYIDDLFNPTSELIKKIQKLHEEFLSKIPNRYSLEKCKQAIEKIKMGENVNLKNFTMIEAAFIESKI